MDIVQGFFTEDFVEELSNQVKKVSYETISRKDLEKITSLSSNNSGLLVIRMKEKEYIPPSGKGIVLVLDGINDPGNLGTIIRIADWYGISSIVCSPDTVDVYNPKTIMATMGSWTRVQVVYQDLEKFLVSQSGVPIYGAYLDGENIRTKKFNREHSCLVIGSESHGIRPYLESSITQKITIPRI